VERGGRFENVEFDELTDDELAAWSKRFPDEGWRWATFLAKWIRDNVVPPDPMAIIDALAPTQERPEGTE
jgi:hypothetical protein